MNIFSRILISAAVITMLFIPFAYQAGATGPKVSQAGNKHNLSAKAWTSDGASYSVSEPSKTYKATDDPTGNPRGQQICIFCHTPHNANVEGGAPLWNRKFSTVTNFQRYSSATLKIRASSSAGYGASWQPDGSSKLCLSCHDGVASLGDVLNGGPIAMTNDLISNTGITSFNPTTNKMKSGHHPVSFTYDATVAGDINTAKPPGNYVVPPGNSPVKLPKNKMQCSTCHDPHQNQSDDTKCYLNDGSVGDCTSGQSSGRKVAPFWVLTTGPSVITDHDSVCLACHTVMNDTGMILTPNDPTVSPNPFPASPL